MMPKWKAALAVVLTVVWMIFIMNEWHRLNKHNLKHISGTECRMFDSTIWDEKKVLAGAVNNYFLDKYKAGPEEVAAACNNRVLAGE